MTNTTAIINNTRASLRKLAADNGWAAQGGYENSPARDQVDQFTRKHLRVYVSFTAEQGRFYSAFLLDDSDRTAGRSGDGIIDEGGVSKVRAWLKAEA